MAQTSGATQSSPSGEFFRCIGRKFEQVIIGRVFAPATNQAIADTETPIEI